MRITVVEVPERQNKTYFIMKKLFFCAAALLAAISFSACSDDDEPNLPLTPESIAGTWQCTHEDGWEIYDGEKDTWSDNYPDEEGWYATCSFDENGSFTQSEYDNDKIDYTGNGTYSISGNKLTIKIKYEDAHTFEIKKLTGSQLVLFDKGADSYGSWEITTTLKRIE